MASSRRDILVIAGLGLAALALPRAVGRWRAAGSPFDFAPVPELPGFRTVTGGEVSAGFADPFVGLVAAGGTDAAAASPIGRETLCARIFGGRGPDAAAVPVAIFSDWFCAWCRVLEDDLAALEAAGRIAVTRHEFPRLGPPSEAAARAALAARQLGAGDAAAARLRRTRVVPDPAYLRQFAAGLGLDPEAFLAATRSAGTDAALGEAAAMAARFGFTATPGTVAGSTAFVGAMAPARLSALIALEAERSPPC